jgi:hypothetical protein
MEPHPIELRLSDDLVRNRLTVAFRIILVIPHAIWLALWGIAVFFAAIASWFATLINGQTPDGLHAFIAQYTRYGTHVAGYFYLVADPYPSFSGNAPYPTDAAIAPPAPQNRWTVAFRIILAIPVMIVSRILDYLMAIVAFLGWFACLFTGMMPLGMRNLNAWCLRFHLQTWAYIGLLTDRYPSFNTQSIPQPAQPVA